MRKLVLLMHTSLDGFVAGPAGEMDWITINEEIYKIPGKLTDEADTALYGRVTYDMMEGYWPTAAESPKATAHTIKHAKWYNSVQKLIVSNSLKDDPKKRRKVIGGNIAEQIAQLKKKEGKDILLIGSPSVIHPLVEKDLVDDYWLLVNSVILGEGIPLFSKTDNKIKLKLESNKVFGDAVVCMHYSRIPTTKQL
jgi:dihydrofolate reductase